MTVAFAIAVSLFVAFTLTPMLSSKLLKLRENSKQRKGLYKATIGRFLDWLNEFYVRTLRFSLKMRIPMIVITTRSSTSVKPKTCPTGRRLFIMIPPTCGRNR